jgi:hypothetical protein
MKIDLPSCKDKLTWTRGKIIHKEILKDDFISYFSEPEKKDVPMLWDTDRY